MSATKHYADLANLTLYDELIKDYVDDKEVELTQAEYDLLPDSKNTDGVNYFITDAPGSGMDYTDLDNKPSINNVILSGNKSASDLSLLGTNDVYSWAKEATKPSYTANEVGAIPTTAKGAASGVAELDANGLVPTSQLPSYVDDVLEYSSSSSFPATGETGKIYVDTTTNKCYRWGGSQYVEISEGVALGETSSTAYRGDRGAELYTAFGGKSVVTTLDSSANIPTSAAVKTVTDGKVNGQGITLAIVNGILQATFDDGTT